MARFIRVSKTPFFPKTSTLQDGYDNYEQPFPARASFVMIPVPEKKFDRKQSRQMEVIVHPRRLSSNKKVRA